ncbi:hypothetical protein ACFOOL_16345 [Devosia honganensis]|uniref:Uncharacterized protein n=1 Tax=Devosia honganensis TaxID=1610527 RepID=A0ABV7X6P3_9HYPH
MIDKFSDPFDMSIFAPEARNLMNMGEQDLFDALSALSREPHNG